VLFQILNIDSFSGDLIHAHQHQIFAYFGCMFELLAFEVQYFIFDTVDDVLVPFLEVRVHFNVYLLTVVFIVKVVVLFFAREGRHATDQSIEHHA